MTPDSNQDRSSGSVSSAAVFTLPLMVSVAMALSGCSWLTSTFRLDNVTDSVDYRSNGGSVSSLEIPPGLTKPRFDDAFVLSHTVAADNKVAPGDQVPTPLVPDAPTAARTAGMDTSVEAASVSQQLPVVLSQLKDGNPALSVGGSFNQVWVKTGSILAKSGLAIIGQQRDKGVYSVSASNGAAAVEDAGFLKKIWSSVNIFSGDAKKSAIEADVYRVVIGDAGDQSLVVISDAAGKPLAPALAKQILERLKAGFEA